MRFPTMCLLALGFSAGIASAQNISTVSTTGTSNSVDVLQEGSNSAVITQGASGAAVSMNEAVIHQVGATNSATITQTGSSNEGVVFQGRVAGFTTNAGTSTNNTAIVEQSGSNNRGFSTSAPGSGDGAVVYQGTNEGTAIDSRAEVSQTGTAGIAAAVQGFGDGVALPAGMADNAYVRIDQAGDNNYATARQGGPQGSSTGDRSLIEQTASTFNGIAFIEQGFGAASSNSVADIFQDGGRGNDARVFQTGDTNIADVFQDGATNVALVTQSSDGNMSDVVQTGSGNRATVTQQ